MPIRYQTDSVVRVVAPSAGQLQKAQGVPDAEVAQVHCCSAAVEPTDSAAAEAEHRKVQAEEERVHRTKMTAEGLRAAGDPFVDATEVGIAATHDSAAAEGNRTRLDHTKGRGEEVLVAVYDAKGVVDENSRIR